MNNELIVMLEYIKQERGIKPEQLLNVLKKAVISASKKQLPPNTHVDVKINPETGEIKAWAKLKVVDEKSKKGEISLAEAKKKDINVKPGDWLQWEVTPENLGRIAAQAARQTMMQQFRKAEKAIVKEEFGDRIGEIVNGVVTRIDEETRDIIVDFQKAEGILPYKNKLPGEQYRRGDRVNALLVKVDVLGNGPSLILSRSDTHFIRKLVEREVSEIHDGIVVIKGIARQPGYRTKIAVQSRDEHVDPIGACVGMRGMRIKNIINELNGEKVDIVPYDEDIKTYISNILHPAKVSRIEYDKKRRKYHVHVPDGHGRIAVGKRAYNVKLCSQLVKKPVSIIEDPKEESFEEKKEKIIKELSKKLDISLQSGEILVNNGYISIEGLLAAEESDISELEGISQDDVEIIRKKIKEFKTE